MEMSSRERFLKALKLEKPDKVPIFDYLYNKEIFKETLGIEAQFTAKEQFSAALIMELDSVFIPMSGIFASNIKYIKKDVYIDEWGITFQITDSSWPVNAPIDYPIKNIEDLRKYNPPDPNKNERYEEMSKVIEMNRKRIALGGLLVGPFSTAWLLQGPERFMVNIFDDPNLLKDIFRISNEYWIPAAIEQIKIGVDYIWLADDLGFNAGPFCSLESFMELIYPFLEEIFMEIRRVDKDIPIVLHSDGNNKIFIDSFIKLGINGIHPFQRSAGWDLREVKKEYGDKICIIGNIDSSNTLTYGTPEDIESEVKEAIEIAAAGGGYVIASDHSLHGSIPMKNIWIMLNAIKKFRYVY